MRMCLVTGIFPPDIGGPASYVALLGESLRSAGWKVEVVTYSSGVGQQVQSFPVHKISRRIPLPVRILVSLVEIVRTAARSDLIYCNGLMLQSAMASLLARKPLVTKVEGDFAWERAVNSGLTRDSIEPFQKRRQGLRVELLRAVRNFCLRRSRTVTTTSRFLARLIRGWGFSGPVEVIANAVEDDFGRDVANLARSECRARIGFPNKRVVVSAGRLVSWKGFQAVVEAAKSLGPEVVVVILGEGPERSKLAGLIEARCFEEKVYLMGKVPRSKVALYLKAADCLVLNSGYESCPHIVLEAMKVGTPVIAARAAGTPELFEEGENGLLFEKDDAEQMVSCINECLWKEELRERLTAGASKRLSRYNWSEIFGRTLAVLEKAAKRL